MSDLDMASVGGRIRVLRKGKGMTQHRLAVLAGCSHPHISDIEKGKKRGSYGARCGIAMALGVSYMSMMYGEDGVDRAVDKLRMLVRRKGNAEDAAAIQMVAERLGYNWAGDDELLEVRG